MKQIGRCVRSNVLVLITLLPVAACAVRTADEWRDYLKSTGVRSESPSQRIDTAIVIDARGEASGKLAAAFANLASEEFAELFTRPLSGPGSTAPFVLRVTVIHGARPGRPIREVFHGEATLIDSTNGAVLGSFQSAGVQHDILVGAEESWRKAYVEMMTRLKSDVAGAFRQPMIQTKLATERSRSNALDERTFQEAVAFYRSQPVQPDLPETARRYKVQADAAIREQKYAEAVELYQSALRLAPWWPEGHFNTALLLADQGLYPEAITGMRRYLLLVPDARDSRAALDKIYEWERRARQ